jgi:hypothetical protein
MILSILGLLVVGWPISGLITGLAYFTVFSRKALLDYTFVALDDVLDLRMRGWLSENFITTFILANTMTGYLTLLTFGNSVKEIRKQTN